MCALFRIRIHSASYCTLRNTARKPVVETGFATARYVRSFVPREATAPCSATASSARRQWSRARLSTVVRTRKALPRRRGASAIGDSFPNQESQRWVRLVGICRVVMLPASSSTRVETVEVITCVALTWNHACAVWHHTDISHPVLCQTTTARPREVARISVEGARSSFGTRRAETAGC